MSKIRDALLAATGLALIAGESHNDLGTRLASAASSLPDAAWDKLDDDQQKWANAAAAAVNEGQAIPAFPDAEAAPPARSRTRATPAPAPAAYVPKLNDVVTIVTKRGAVSSGPLVEITADLYVLDIDGKDAEFTRDRVESITPVGAASGGAPETELPRDPAVGDTVEAITTRGATIVGNVLEIDGPVIVLKDATGAEHELSMDRLKSLKVKVTAAAPAPASTRTRAAAPAPASTPAAPAPATRTRSSNPEGVSATLRLRQVIAEFPEYTQEQVAAKVRGEGLEFKDNTAGMIFGDCHKFLDILKKLGRLK